MVMIPERLRELTDDELFEVRLDPERLRSTVSRSREAHAADARFQVTHAVGHKLSTPWTGGLAAAWVAGMTAVVLVEPTASNPDAPLPLWAALLGLVSLVALGALAGAVLRRSRSAIGWSALNVGLLAVGVAACPLSAHHVGIGGWWAAQVGITAALGGFTAFAARRA